VIPLQGNLRKSSALICVFAFFLGCFFLAPRPAAANAYDDLRLKWKDYLTGGAAFSSDTDVIGLAAQISDNAQAYWDAMDKSGVRSYLWSDLDQANTSDAKTKSSYITLSYNRLESMALAYSTPNSSLYQDQDMLADLLSGLDWMYANKYNESKSETGNWFDWQIGVPLSLNNLIVLLYDELTSTQIANNMNAVVHFQPSVTLTGANRVWESHIVALSGVITESSGKIAAGRNGLSAVFKYVNSGDGFYKDGSFIQHNNHASNGSYGVALMENLIKLMFLLDGSAWEVTDANSQNVYDWVYNAYEPLIYKGAMMDMSRGRSISRRTQQDHLVGGNVMESLVQLTSFAPPPDAARIKSMIKYWIQEDVFSDFFEHANTAYSILQAKLIVNDSNVSARGELILHKQYPNMDRAVHLRPGFGFALSMNSNRIYNYESINGENLKGWYTSDGMTYLYNSDLGQYSDEYWALVNKYRLPGTTVDTQARTNSSAQSALSSKNWVGGTAVASLYGVSGMELDASLSTLTAKKSWFMFADKVVALGAGITSTDGRTIETVIDNRKMNHSATNILTVDGIAKSASMPWSETMNGVSWAHLEGDEPGADIGYYFPDGATVKGLRETRTATWQSVNSYVKFTDATSLSRDFMTLWFDHGANPTNGSYAYVLLPNKTASQMSAYAASPDIVILENSGDAQAVQDTSLNAIGINFWKDGLKTIDADSLPFLSSNKKASVMTLESASDIEVSVSDPTQANTGSIEIELHRAATGVLSVNTGIQVTQLTPTIKFTVDVKGAKGKSFSVKFDYTPVVPEWIVEHFDATPVGEMPQGWTTNTAGGTVQAAATPSSSNRSLELTDNSSSAYVSAAQSFEAISGPVTAEFKAKFGSESFYALHLYDGTTQAVRLRTYNGNIQILNGGTYETLQTYSPGTWYAFKIAADSLTDKVDIYIDGMLVKSQADFVNPVSSIDSIQFTTHTATAGMVMNIDDIAVLPANVSVNESFNTIGTGLQPDGWTISNAGGAVAVADVPGTANKVLQLVDTSTSAAIIANKSFEEQTDSVTVEAKVRFGTSGLYYLKLMSGSAVAVRIRTSSGHLQAANNGVNVNLQTYSANQWYHIKIVANLATNKTDIYVDGTLRQSQGDFNAAATGIDAIEFATHTSTSDMSLDVDDVVVMK